MTLLVGILCDDGVVIAADQQVTHGGLAGLTVAQAGVKPVIICGQAIYASSGPVSVGQQITAKLTDLQRTFGSGTCAGLVPKLQASIREVLDPAFATAAQAQKAMGPQAALQDVLCCGLLAGKFSDGIHLLDISHQGACEVLTKDKVPFVCLGSGKGNADPILRFLWNIYWQKQSPTLQEATLAAYWTVRTAIELKTPLVGFAVDVFVLEKHGAGGKHVKAHKLNADRLAEHDGFIDAVAEQMRGVRDRMLAGPGAVEPGAAEPAAPPVPTQ